MEGRRGKSRSKLSDVASLAGVSASTASLVLAGKGEAHRISEEAHRRVHEAAAKLDYVPSLLHRSVRRGRTHILSFYSGFRNREPGDLYMDRLSAAIEHAGGRHRYNILVHCDFEQSARETYAFLNGGFADGVVLFGSRLNDPLLGLLRGSSLPTVVISPAEPESVLSSVTVDEEPGLIALADALFDAGHRRVAGILVDWPGFRDPSRRYETLLARLRARGAESPDLGFVVENADHRDALRRVLAHPQRPTAIFAWHDRLAYQLLEACQEIGIEIPRDLSIVGYDGLAWPSTAPHAATSVGVSLEILAESAVSLLARLVEGESGPVAERVPVHFVPGTTLGPVPAGPPDRRTANGTYF